MRCVNLWQWWINFRVISTAVLFPFDQSRSEATDYHTHHRPTTSACINAVHLLSYKFRAWSSWVWIMGNVLVFELWLTKTYASSRIYTVVQKNAPTSADYNYDPVQSILIIFSKLFANDHKSCLMVKFFTSPHICCHYTLWNTMLYFALITLLIAKNAPTSDNHNFNKR